MSTDEVRFGAVGDGTSARLFNPERHQSGSVDYFTIELGDRSASARLRVYAHDASRLAELFESMASEWRGWPGEKRWHSPESEFELVATADGRGHVAVQIRLTPPTSPYPPPWRFECRLPLEAGQLDRVAEQVRSFVDGSG